MKICSIEGCNNPVNSRKGWCGTHLARWKRNGDPNKLQDRSPDPCSVPGCSKISIACGYCRSHWRRWHLYGDPNIDKVKKKNICSVEGCGLFCSGRGFCKRHYQIWLDAHPNSVCTVSGCSGTYRIKRGLCSKHYHRWQRHGDPLAISRKPNRNKDLAVGFWECVDKTPGFGPKGDCWTWIGNRQSNGYGTISVNCKHKPAHRVSWELANGEIPDGVFVLHKCDVPLCIRPDHLFLGDQQANVSDCINKGRFKFLGEHKGEEHPRSTLTDAQVLEIRRRYTGRFGECLELAKEYGVSRPVINRVINNKTWKHLLPTSNQGDR